MKHETREEREALIKAIGFNKPVPSMVVVPLKTRKLMRQIELAQINLAHCSNLKVQLEDRISALRGLLLSLGEEPCT